MGEGRGWWGGGRGGEGGAGRGREVGGGVEGGFYVGAGGGRWRQGGARGSGRGGATGGVGRMWLGHDWGRGGEIHGAIYGMKNINGQVYFLKRRCSTVRKAAANGKEYKIRAAKDCTQVLARAGRRLMAIETGTKTKHRKRQESNNAKVLNGNSTGALKTDFHVMQTADVLQ